MQTEAWPTHLAEIFRRKPTHLELCNALGLGVGGMWLDPSRSGRNLVWRHPWLLDIIADLVSSNNLKGTITKSDLELVALILHEATLRMAVPTARMATPRSRTDNTTTILWSAC